MEVEGPTDFDGGRKTTSLEMEDAVIVGISVERGKEGLSMLSVLINKVRRMNSLSIIGQSVHVV